MFDRQHLHDQINEVIEAVVTGLGPGPGPHHTIEAVNVHVVVLKLLMKEIRVI